jgi:PKD repeat protein
MHTYTTGGKYSVKLTVTDSVLGTKSITKTDFIEVDIPNADFTHRLLGCNVVAFTDTSTGRPTAWAWDVDNNGTVDYNIQHPVHQYPGPGIYQCKLTASNSFGSSTVIKRVQVGVGSLTTLFAQNNAGSVGGIVYMDLTVKSPVSVNAFETNYNAAVGVAVGMVVYTTPTTYLGNEANMAAWTQVAMDNGTATSAGTNNPTSITLAAPFTLQPGKYGVALVAIGSGHTYTNGNGTNQAYSNADLDLALGAALNVPFTGTPFTPRVWNGTYLYTKVAGSENYGTATPSGTGAAAPSLTTTAPPRIGQIATLSMVQNDAGASGFVMIGIGRGPTPLPFGPLNLGTSILAINVASPMPVGSPRAFNFMVPNDCTLEGKRATWVNINLVPGSPNLISMSNGTEWYLAN